MVRIIRRFVFNPFSILIVIFASYLTTFFFGFLFSVRHDGLVLGLLMPILFFFIISLSIGGLNSLLILLFLRLKNVNLFDFFFKFGANINAYGYSGWTPLFFAVEQNDLKFSEYLVSKGASTNSASFRGSTPLHIAAMIGNLDLVKFLISNGALVNATNNEKNTPLHFAALNGNILVFSFLLGKQANPQLQNKSNKTPFDIQQSTMPGLTFPTIEELEAFAENTEKNIAFHDLVKIEREMTILHYRKNYYSFIVGRILAVGLAISVAILILLSRAHLDPLNLIIIFFAFFMVFLKVRNFSLGDDFSNLDLKESMLYKIWCEIHKGQSINVGNRDLNINTLSEILNSVKLQPPQTKDRSNVA